MSRRDLERSGVAREEAERRARIEFGGYQRFKEECRETVGGHFGEVLLQDARFGFRMMRKNPGFTTVAVLTLALGIAANAVVFSVLNALVLRPIDLPQARSLYMVENGRTISCSPIPTTSICATAAVRSRACWPLP